MWDSAKTVASTPNSAIIQPNVDDNFVINSTHLNMIRENKFNVYLRANPHDHIREFLAICDMFKYGETQSEAVKLLIFPFSLCDEAITWFNELNEDYTTSWEQMRKTFRNKFFPPSLFNWHGLTKGAVIQIFYHGLEEPTQEILDIIAKGIFLYKSPNQATQFLEDKVLFKLEWPTKSQNKRHQKSVSFADGRNSDDDHSRLIKKLEALTVKKDSQIISLNEELQDMHNKYNELREGNASKNHLNDDTTMCERREANYIQSKGNKDQNSHDSYSHQSHHDPNDSEKLLTKLNNDVRNDLEDFKRPGSESRPPMLNKENYVPWSSCLLRYAKSRLNRKLIHNSILNGPYVRRIIPEPGDANREVTTILLGLPKDIYPAVDSCETAQEIWLRVQQMVKGSDIGIQEKKAKLFNEWERFTFNEGEIESYYHRFLKLMNDLKRKKHFPEKIASNLMFLNNLQPEWSRHHLIKINQNYLQQPMPNPKDITDPTTAMHMALALMAKAFKLNYSTPTNNNQRISSNPRNRQIAQPGMNMGQDRQMRMVGGNGRNQFRQYAGQNARNLTGYNDAIGNQIGNGNLVAARTERNATGQNGNQIRCYNCRGVGHYARNYTVRPRRRDTTYLQTQLLIAQMEEAGIQLQAEEYDLMVAAADLDEIKEVNANSILMANLQQASTSGTQTDRAPVYDSDGSTEVHENCDNNEIFNMFTQEEQYTELHKPIFESHQVPQNDNNVISEATSVEQGGEIVEQHLANFEETRALYDSLYQNLAIEVEKVNSINRKLKETNADLTTELARFKNQK
nr:hypothetical protein [Tanacetum cinerariifolium]